MDRFTKITLGVIAMSLVALNLQLLGGEIITPASAALDQSDYSMISDGIDRIVKAIYSCN